LGEIDDYDDHASCCRNQGTLLTGAEWSPADARDLLQRTAEIKARPSRYASTLRGKHIALDL